MPNSNQTTHVFIPGKNGKLSLAELVSFLEAREIKFKICAFSKAFFAVNSENKADAAAIADLGGIIKIGDVATEFATEIVEKAFLQKDKQAQEQIRNSITSNIPIDEMFELASGKSVFGVSVYCTEKALRSVSKIMQRFVGSSLKRELAAHGKKANFMGFSKNREQPQLSHIEVLKKNMVENKAEILFCVGINQTVLATTVAVHNPFEFQKRDIGKPNQRKIFAMPPRLAKIMINLASCTPGKTLLDPFCGVGTILQEALLAKAKVFGVDINPWCVKAAEENLEWLKKEYALKEAEYTVMPGDARRLKDKIEQELDCIVTEPDLGPALRHMATTPYATKIIGKLEPLYYSFLKEAYKLLKRDGRLVLVAPYIKTRSGKPVTMQIGEEAVKTGFIKVHLFQRRVFAEDSGVQENLMEMASFVDVEERHKIGREIHIFQK